MKLAEQLEGEKVDNIIFRMKQKYRNSRAQAEQSRREDNTRFVRGVDFLRRGFSNNVQDREAKFDSTQEGWKQLGPSTLFIKQQY